MRWDLGEHEVMRDRELDGERITGVAQGARLVGCTFLDCVFDGVDLSRAELTDSRFVGCTFVASKLLAVSWGAIGGWGVAQTPVTFERCRMEWSSFAGVDLTGAVLRECTLTEVDFADATARRAVITGCDLTGARFARTDLREADLRGSSGLVLDPTSSRVRGLRIEPWQAPGLLAPLGVELE